MQIAAFSLAEVTYAVGGDIGYQVQESAKSARFRVRTKQENVSGVFLPAFESYTTEGNNDFGLTGLGKGGQQVQRCRETYARAVETLVELASLQVLVSWKGKLGQLTDFLRLHSLYWTKSLRSSTGEVRYINFTPYDLNANNNSECHVSIPPAQLYVILTQVSEHVIIPRTENTIKCLILHSWSNGAC
jgi:ATP synthase subunit D